MAGDWRDTREKGWKSISRWWQNLATSECVETAYFYWFLNIFHGGNGMRARVCVWLGGYIYFFIFAICDAKIRGWTIQLSTVLVEPMVTRRSTATTKHFYICSKTTWMAGCCYAILNRRRCITIRFVTLICSFGSALFLMWNNEKGDRVLCAFAGGNPNMLVRNRA